MLYEPDGSDDEDRPDTALRYSRLAAVAANTLSAFTLVQLPDVFVEALWLHEDTENGKRELIKLVDRDASVQAGTADTERTSVCLLAWQRRSKGQRAEQGARHGQRG